MGGALKAISSLAGPIMNMASMFSPVGAIMKGIQMAMGFAKQIGEAVKSVAPNAMKGLDEKIEKAGSWAQKAVGKAQDFLTKVAGGVQALGNAAQPANPTPAINIPLFN